jgi:8-oxo-dGTP diphosphatase
MNTIRVGVACFISKKCNYNVRKVLFGHRIKENILAIPGGHLEFGETFEQGARREIAEECGPNLKVDYKGELWVSNNFFRAWNKHSITIWLGFEWVSGEPVNAEPDKCAGWEWKDWHELQAAVPRLADAFWKYNEILTDEQSQFIPLPQIYQKRDLIGI